MHLDMTSLPLRSLYRAEMTTSFPMHVTPSILSDVSCTSVDRQISKSAFGTKYTAKIKQMSHILVPSNKSRTKEQTNQPSDPAITIIMTTRITGSIIKTKIKSILN